MSTVRTQAGGERGRQTHLDVAKSLAAVVIVLHHAAIYGPLAQALEHAWPRLSPWLAQYGRFAVQVFLVIGGYLVAQSALETWAARPVSWPRRVIQRWWRLAVPFVAAVLLTLLAHAATAAWLPELRPNSVSMLQLLAHAALLHDLLDFEALTVGAWYVAIDLQLFALLTLLLSSGPADRWRWVLVIGLVALSLFAVNLDPDWDHLAVYFFGSYGLGACAAAVAWQARRPPAWWWLGTLALLCLVLAALLYDFRGRIALAGATALALLLLQRWPWRPGPLASRLWKAAGERAYGLFLVHFSVLLCVNALFVLMQGRVPDAWLASSLLVCALAVSCLVAAAFFHQVERPVSRWLPTFLR